MESTKTARQYYQDLKAAEAAKKNKQTEVAKVQDVAAEEVAQVKAQAKRGKAKK